MGMSRRRGSVPFLPWIKQCTAGLTIDRANHTFDSGMAWALGLISFSIGNIVLDPNPKTPNSSMTTVAPNTIFNPGLWTLGRHHPG